jgi:putative peptide zinc metalloprotease protein
VAAVGFVIAHALTAWPPLSVAVLLTLAACALSLNPILKFDGYWVVADALGVANLGHVPARLGAFAWAKLRGRRAARLPWHWSIVAVLAIYSVATTAFWLYFLSRLIITGTELASTYPALVRAVWQPVQTGSLDGQALFALFNATLVILFGALVVQRLVRAMVRFVASRIRPPIAGG